MSIRKQQGFTLIELMVTLVVLGVVLTLGLSGFNKQILSNRSAAFGEDFMAALSFARSETIRQGQGGGARFITLCASADGVNCSNNTAGWGAGFIAVVDYATAEKLPPNLANPALPDDPPTVLKVWPKQDAKAVISVRHGVNAATPTSFIRYTKSGKLAARTVPASPIIIRTKMTDKTATDCLANSGKQIEISIVGMVRVANTNCW